MSGGIATFSMSDLKPLALELSEAPFYTPTIEDLFDPNLYLDGVVRNKEGKTEEEVGDLFWPDRSRIDQSKLGPRFILVGDQGIYMITNSGVGGTPVQRGTIAYAHGCNPDKDYDFYEKKVELFGGDDGSISVPVNWFFICLDAGKSEMSIRLKPDSFQLVRD